MKIKDLDKKTIDYYCDVHRCIDVLYMIFSEKLSINCNGRSSACAISSKVI